MRSKSSGSITRHLEPDVLDAVRPPLPNVFEMFRAETTLS